MGVGLFPWTKLGPSCLDGLDGMFALAVYDPRVGKLFLARDRLGEKALYWRLDGGRLAFASEVTTLIGYGSAPLIVRPEMLAIETPVGVDTPFQGIQLLAPATLLTFDVVTASLQQTIWWRTDSGQYLRSVASYAPQAHAEVADLINRRLTLEIRYESPYGGENFRVVLRPHR